ncbi:pyocin knob domain-containing protein [Volucribacter amazonae]|uniref:Putative tail fiber protein gp53-like C-terminal domain-containing protein n=1 Tax=Volucribacter amazonae TaxID=256731 RepID=A0A9X4PH05_9PAST|nr:pyocin knob domain-containing protein [Volucribacter amazonae]MDG6895030.1 hypothetical protein [Volucribacter amazonae]
MKDLLKKINSNDGNFHNGNPATGEQGTRVTAEWLNDNQNTLISYGEELNYVLTQAKLSPIPSKKTQLYEAIVNVIKAITGTPFQNFSATSSLNNMTNLNDLKGTGKYGVYSQSSNSNALTALNYPEQKAGTLFVLPSAYQGIQLYVPFDNQIIYIRRTNQASGFENWRIIGEVIDNLNSDSKTAGLSARQGKLLNENKAEKTEVMPLQRTSLSATDDLNDFRQNGIFAQTTSARASIERNYPEAVAGVLEVLYNGNFQRYTTFNSVCYQRDYRSGKWQDWRRVDSLGKVDRTGDTINGLLRINAQSGWSLLRLGTNQGYWDLEVNPNSESDRRLNLKYTNDSGSSTYIRFPATRVEQNIAYQSWVTEQAKNYVNKDDFTQNLSGTGWCKLPNGLILQWGQVSDAGNKSFPIAFPNVALIVLATNINRQGDRVDNSFAYVVDKATFYYGAKSSAFNGVTGSAGAFLAIGY